ncbi:type III-B CRISPR module-associated protein Cmr5 [Marinomonas mediterranea]|uniref:type III-B CRISPR module-associated protein Cmr5 n=1 Tax=Marinomonas mediterranea TaxID=119864 RepID=UPI00234A5E2B|nr:type III-B CRISPR module-associated protein Cmr5 [Marinomonas mediterranea]WCN08277.1 type III-B CRISPR module-associated protein Cmr5 [Marinomonas mediterranea]
MIMTRQHVIANIAFDCISKRVEESETAKNKEEKKKAIDPKKYSALANKFPSLILQNGLAQATGFLLAKKETEHLALLNDLALVLSHSESFHFDPNTASEARGQALHKLIIDSDLTKLMQQTQLTLEASGALRRYVQGLMTTDEPKDTETNNA